MRQRHLESVWSQQVQVTPPCPRRSWLVWGGRFAAQGCSWLGHRLHNPAWQLWPWGCKMQSCPWQSRSSDSPESWPHLPGLPGFPKAHNKMLITRVLTTKSGKSLFPTETGQNCCNAPEIEDVKVHAKCWKLAWRGRDGERRGRFSFFKTLFINKAPV